VTTSSKNGDIDDSTTFISAIKKSPNSPNLAQLTAMEEGSKEPLRPTAAAATNPLPQVLTSYSFYNRGSEGDIVAAYQLYNSRNNNNNNSDAVSIVPKEDGHGDLADTCDSLASLLRAPTSTTAVTVDVTTSSTPAAIVDDTIGEKGHIVLKKHYYINHYAHDAAAATPAPVSDDQKKMKALEWLMKAYKLCGPIMLAVKTIRQWLN
jgi:hypothetical protein